MYVGTHATCFICTCFILIGFKCVFSCKVLLSIDVNSIGYLLTSVYCVVHYWAQMDYLLHNSVSYVNYQWHIPNNDKTFTNVFTATVTSHSLFCTVQNEKYTFILHFFYQKEYNKYTRTSSIFRRHLDRTRE